MTIERIHNATVESFTADLSAQIAAQDLRDLMYQGSCVLRQFTIDYIEYDEQWMKHRVVFSFVNHLPESSGGGVEVLRAHILWDSMTKFGNKLPTLTVSRQNILSPECIGLEDFRDKYSDDVTFLQVAHLGFGTLEDHKYVHVRQVEVDRIHHIFECKKDGVRRTYIKYIVDLDNKIHNIIDYSDNSSLSLEELVAKHGTPFDNKADEEVSDVLQAKLDLADQWIIANEMDGEDRFHANSDRLTYSPSSLREMIHDMLTDMENK